MIDTIKTFGINIWQWFVENKDGITAFFMSGQFASLIAAAVMLVKNIKQTKANTQSTKTLNLALDKNNEMSQSVEKIGKDFQELKSENESLREELKNTEKKLEESNTRIQDSLNAMLEVQSIVYSTIRDDEVRMTVNKLLNNARYSDKNFKLELQTEIENMKKDFENRVNDMNKALTDSMSKVNNSINAGAKAEKKMNETTRY